MNQPQPIAVMNVTPELQYALMDTGALYRNDQQVLIPLPGVNLIAEMRHILEILNSVDLSSLKGVEAEEDQPVGEVPPDVRDLPVDHHTTDLTWKGFEVRGYMEHGQAKAEVEHPETGTSRTFSWGSAKDAIDDPDREDNLYDYLCAKAFMAWWDRNGLDDVHKGPQLSAPRVPPLPEWTPGTTVRHRHLPEVYGVVWSDPSRPAMRTLVVNNGDTIDLVNGNEFILSDYEALTEEMGG